MFTYRKILSKAWQITWQNPTFWFFGFFVALLGVGGEIEILLGSVTLGDSQGFLPSFLTGLFEGGLFSSNGLAGIATTLINRPFSFISLLLWLVTILFLSLVVIWLVIVSQGAIINGVVSVVKNKRLSWASHFESGLKTFWPVLIINFLAKIIFGALFLALSWLAINQFPGSILLFMAAFIIFVGIILIIAFIIKYAICATVLQSKSVGDSIDSAIKLFQKNWLLSLEIATVLFLIYWIATVLIINLLSAFFLSTLRVFGVTGSVALVAFIIILMVAIISQILLAIFHWSAWVLVFELLTNKKEVLSSRLASWFKKMVDH